jgi:hypothetical protein
LVYEDFEFLFKFKSAIESFGTVGVGHIWHLTLHTPDVIESILALTFEGNIFVKKVIPIHIYVDIQKSNILQPFIGYPFGSHITLSRKLFPNCLVLEQFVIISEYPRVPFMGAIQPNAVLFAQLVLLPYPIL